MNERGEFSAPLEEEVARQAHEAWEQYHLTHNGQQLNSEYGWLMWRREMGGWVQLSRRRMDEEDEDPESPSLTIDVRDDQAVLESSFYTIVDEPLEPTEVSVYPSEELLGEILELLNTPPLESEQAIEAFRERDRVNLARAFKSGNIIVAPDFERDRQEGSAVINMLKAVIDKLKRR
jgi:hypothetical protein